ncbi:hypothetical protein [Sabulicella rubraurantiaca]|uniref:hypothetical protein n=1 Tax=Sabulicella rubraurantiaca TaxID=2811429 RepID=UPI001A961113|nr:hypothetical protein [Sabulicella rubraurantiaca]
MTRPALLLTAALLPAYAAVDPPRSYNNMERACFQHGGAFAIRVKVEGTTTEGAQRHLFQGTGLEASRCWEMKSFSRIRFEVTWLKGLS